jgi:predicted RNA polymerase sigma factor
VVKVWSKEYAPLDAGVGSASGSRENHHRYASSRRCHATRRLMDQVRSEKSRRNREAMIAVATPQSELLGPPADAAPADEDDSLALLFGCCHPELSPPSQVALTLRAVGGLSTAQIAAAFGVPEATMAQRISRAKQAIRDAGFDFALPDGTERTERLRAVLHVLYLIFNEGYAATGGDALTVPELSREAIRLTRWLHRLLPRDGEVTGLLALMLLTDARRAARTLPDGSLVPLLPGGCQAGDEPARAPPPGPAGRPAIRVRAQPIVRPKFVLRAPDRRR